MSFDVVISSPMIQGRRIIQLDRTPGSELVFPGFKLWDDEWAGFRPKTPGVCDPRSLALVELDLSKVRSVRCKRPPQVSRGAFMTHLLEERQEFIFLDVAVWTAIKRRKPADFLEAATMDRAGYPLYQYLATVYAGDRRGAPFQPEFFFRGSRGNYRFVRNAAGRPVRECDSFLAIEA